MKTILTLAALLPLILGAGCSTFKVGSGAYCAWGQSCTFSVTAPAPAASAVK